MAGHTDLGGLVVNWPWQCSCDRATKHQAYVGVFGDFPYGIFLTGHLKWYGRWVCSEFGLYIDLCAYYGGDICGCFEPFWRKSRCRTLERLQRVGAGSSLARLSHVVVDGFACGDSADSGVFCQTGGVASRD